MKTIRTLGKTLLIILIIFIILSIALFFFNKFYLSGILTSKLTVLLEKETDRKVEIKNATFGLIKGLSISDITIFDEQSPKAPFLKINSLSFKISFLPFRKDGKFNIPLSITADNAELSIIRKTENEFNFSSLKILQARTTEEPKSQSKITVLPTGITFKDIKIYFRDGFLEPTLSKVRDLSIKDANVQFKLPAKLNFNISGHLNPGDTLIAINGEFLLPEKSLSATLNMNNLPAEQYQAYYANFPIALKSAVIEKIATEISLEDKLLSLETSAILKNVDFENNSLNIKGEFLMNADAEYNLSTKNINYNGSLKIINANVSGINLLKEIDRINGEVKFSKDTLETKGITGFILNTPLSLEGKLYDFKNPYLYLHLLSDFDLSAVTQFFAENLKNTPLKLQGKSKLDAKFEGNLKNKESLDYSGTLDLAETQILYEPLKEPINIKQTQIKLEKNKITSENINANYKNSGFQVKLLVDATDFDNLKLNVTGDTSLELTDLGSDKLPLQGSIEANFRLDTKLKDFKNADLYFNFDSNSVKAQGINFKSISGSYTQSNGAGRINLSSSDTYSGTIKITADVVNPFAKEISYKGNINISNIDLAKLKLDTPLKNKEFSGTLSSYIEAQSSSLDLNNLIGTGNIAIKNGNLWELKPLNAIANALKIGNLVQFSECSGTFSIANKKINTQDFKLTSPDGNILIAVAGSVGFDKQLDLNIKTRIERTLLSPELEIKDVPAAILATGTLPFNIRIVGPWDDFKIKAELAIMSTLGETIRQGTKKLKDIFGGKGGFGGLEDILK